jgi:hypothetical protein
MASSSRPFESQTVSRLMASYRSLQHGAKTLFLRGRLALLWGVQVAVFPAYVTFQSIRTGYRRLQTKHPLQQLKRLLTGKTAQALPLTADTPIRALLSVIQPQIAPQGGWLRPVSYHGAFLRQSHAGGVLTNGGWHLVPIKESIRGIASDLATRKLVLVTVGNSIFEGLTEDQQSRLESAIALLLAEYAATLKQRQWEQTLAQPGLPLPKSEPTQWPVVRWFQRGMRWMQTGSLAAVTNLFGEAAQRERLQLLEGKRHFWGLLTLPNPAPQPLLAEPEWLQPKAFKPAETRVTDLQIGMKKSQVATFGHEASETSVAEPSTQVSNALSVPAFTNEIADSSWPLEIDTVEAQVSEVHYIDHWFVQLLRWIDQGLGWFEQGVQRLWAWFYNRL